MRVRVWRASYSFPCEETQVEKKRKVDPATPEIVFHHELPGVLAEEFVHSYGVKGIIDLTLGPCTWAAVAVQHSIPYFGVVLSSKHMTAAFSRLEAKVLEMTKTESSPLYLGATTVPGRPLTVPNKKPAKPQPKGKTVPAPAPHSPADSQVSEEGDA